MDSIGKRVRAARNRLTWTQEDLETHSGITEVSISRIENDQTVPRQSTARKLAKALGVDPAWILLGDAAARLDEEIDRGQPRDTSLSR